MLFGPLGELFGPPMCLWLQWEQQFHQNVAVAAMAATIAAGGDLGKGEETHVPVAATRARI